MDVRDQAGAHARRRTLAKTLAAVACAGLWAGAAALLWRTDVPHLRVPDLDVRSYFGAGELARAERFRTVTRAMWLASTALELSVVALFAWRARPLAAVLRRALAGPVRVGVALALAVLLASWLTVLPLGALAHWWRRRYGLTEQAWPAWLADGAISLGIRAVLLVLAVAGAVALAIRLRGRWWLAAAPGLVLLAGLFVLAQPLLVQPLFNRFQPLPDRSLAADVKRLGNEVGVDVETVQVADASRRTTTANAYVAGLGPTRRVVFYDTILDGRFSDRELASVAAHELAHVSRHHLWKGIAWFALLAVPGLALVAWATERRGGLRDPALVPLGLLIALVVSLATLPLQNAVSRRYEAEADWIALRATGDPAGSIGLDRRLAATALADPDPPGWARILLATHPPTIDRIAMAEAYRRSLARRA
ncbi:MAG: M48 family metalloprotease [Thermoleophilia bacterium]|nr:M48 family metalloprotease [Thermoleophilia bacterium]